MGDTALTQAIQKGFYKMVTLVMDAGANVNLKIKVHSFSSL
jgi:hypothetical protein